MLQRSFTQESLTAVAASPNGAYLAAGGNSGTIYVWDTASGALLRSWPAHYKVRMPRLALSNVLKAPCNIQQSNTCSVYM